MSHNAKLSKVGISMGGKHVGFGYPRSVLMLAACYLRGMRTETVLQRDTENYMYGGHTG